MYKQFTNGIHAKYYRFLLDINSLIRKIGHAIDMKTVDNQVVLILRKMYPEEEDEYRDFEEYMSKRAK